MPKCSVAKAINSTYAKRMGSCQLWRLDTLDSGKRFALYRWDNGEVDIKCMEGDGREDTFKVFEEKALTPPIDNAGVEAEVKALAKKHFNIDDITFKYAQGVIIIK